VRSHHKPLLSDSVTVLSASVDENADRGGINWSVAGQSALNQLVIGISIFTGGDGAQLLERSASWTPDALVLGVLAAAPLIALSRFIESSEAYILSGLNLSTNMAVLRFLGPKPLPLQAGVVSLALASLTGVVEEVTFRGQILPALANRVGGGSLAVGAVLSATLFAVLHTNPLSFFKGGEATLDNIVLLLLQIVNGGMFCVAFLLTGQNLAVPIVAHAIYDFYTFYKTHLVDVAGQMAYAQESRLMWSKSSKIEAKWASQRGDDFVLGVKQSFYQMDTNRDGLLSRKELRIALFAYGINLSVVQSAKVAAAADTDNSGLIDLDEFLEFVGPTGSTGKAVRNSLYGAT